MYKRISLLSKSPKASKLSIIIVLFVIIIILISYYTKIYSSYKTDAIIDCTETCKIEILIPSNKNEIINKDLSIIHDNKKYHVQELLIEDIIIENNIIYTKVQIKTDLVLNKSNIIPIKIVYDKQRVIRKIINIMKG